MSARRTANSGSDRAWHQAVNWLSMLIEEPAVPVAQAVSRLADSAHTDHLRKMRGVVAAP